VFTVTLKAAHHVSVIEGGHNRNSSELNKLLGKAKEINWRRASRSEWRDAYNNTGDSSSADLVLVVDELCVNVTTPKILTFSTAGINCGSEVVNKISADEKNGTFMRLPIQYYNQKNHVFENATPSWPPPLTSDFLINFYEMMPISFVDDWILEYPLHIDYAMREVRDKDHRLQMAISLLVVVLICNLCKAGCIYLTLSESASGALVTQGDAVASFLKHPDPTTAGLSTLNKTKLIKEFRRGEKGIPEPWDRWESRRIPTARRISCAIL
jgi:hypothetical protein